MTREEAVVVLRKMRIALNGVATDSDDEVRQFSLVLLDLWGRVDCALEIAIDDMNAAADAAKGAGK